MTIVNGFLLSSQRLLFGCMSLSLSISITASQQHINMRNIFYNMQHYKRLNLCQEKSSLINQIYPCVSYMDYNHSRHICT